YVRSFPTRRSSDLALSLLLGPGHVIVDRCGQAREEVARCPRVEQRMKGELEEQLVEPALDVVPRDPGAQPAAQRLPAGSRRAEHLLRPERLRVVDHAVDQSFLLQSLEGGVDRAGAAAVVADGGGLEDVHQVVAGLRRGRQQAENGEFERGRIGHRLGSSYVQQYYAS